MPTATLAKLALTASVGLGTLITLAGPARAETPPQQGGMVLTTPTTTPAPDPIPPVDGHIALPEADPDPEPPVDVPDLPLADPQGPGDPDPCPQISCDLELPDAGDEPDDPGACDTIALCDELAQPEPGCTLTHGCEAPTPECPGPQASCDLTDDPGEPDGEEPDGEEPGGDDGSSGGDRGSLPRTGATLGALLLAGTGLTGLGAVLRRSGRSTG